MCLPNSYVRIIYMQLIHLWTSTVRWLNLTPPPPPPQSQLSPPVLLKHTNYSRVAIYGIWLANP